MSFRSRVGFNSRSVLIRRLAICIGALLVEATGQAYGGIADTLLRGGAGDGKIAKYEFTLHDNMFVTSVTWSPDGKYIAATSTQSATLHLWDIQKRKLIVNIPRDDLGDISELSWSPDGRYLPVCGAHGKLRVYSGSNLSEQHLILQRDGRSCQVIAFSSDGSQFAALGIISRTLEIYSTGDWRLLHHYDNARGWARGHAFDAIAYVPGTLTLAVGGGEFEHRGTSNAMNGFIYFYNPDDAEPSRRIQVYQYEEGKGLPGQVTALAFSPDRQRVATGTSTGSGTGSDYIRSGVRVLDLSDGSVVGRPLDGAGLDVGGPGGLVYAPDGRYLITGHRDTHSPIHILDAKTAQIADAVPAGGTVWDVTVNPRGGAFAAGIDKSIVVWSLPDR